MENIDEYYRSLKEIFDYLVDWKQPPTARRRASSVFMTLVVASMFSLTLTLIPVLPFVLSIVLPKLGRGLTAITMLGVRLEPLMQYWLLSLAGSGAATTIFMLLGIYLEPPSSEPEYSLSPDQVSFVLLYTAFEELRLYLIDNLTVHLDKARRAIERLLLRPRSVLYSRRRREMLLREAELSELENLSQNLPPDFVVREEPRFPLPTPAMASQLEITSRFLRTYERYGWFRMETQTDVALRALSSFRSIIYTRLVAKEDLAKVKTVLEHMARWIYAYLPELEASRTPEELEALRQAGDRELAEFAAEMESVTEYELPSPPVPEKRPRGASLIRGILTSEDTLVRFIVYFLFVLILTSALSLVAVQVFGVQREGAVVMTISTSIVGGAGLAGLPVVIKGARKT